VALRCRGLVVSPGGAEVLDGLELEVATAQLTVLVGPSGAGKTTLLRAVAGLEELDGGRLELHGRDAAGVPAHRRRIGMVFQQPRLFPHLDVVDNVAFPLRAAGVGRRERRQRAHALLAEVGIAELAGRAPRALSGGEQQRVAVARALSVEPELLMLDEPIASVDPNKREELRGFLRALQRQRAVTTLYVTHERAEAAELGDEVAVMLAGRIAAHDHPRQLFERPPSEAVARFFGNDNIVHTEVTAGRARIGGAWLDVGGPDGHATLTIRPERIRLDPAGPLPMRVAEARYAGTYTRLELTGQELTLQAHVAPDEAPVPGCRVGVALPAADLWRLPAHAPSPEPVGS
jgi:thiamine transport system ATP-binding protein